MELSLFKPHLETVFTLLTPEGEEDLKLALLEAEEIKDHRPRGERSGRPPFALVFGCETFLIPQGTYRLEHDILDPIEIFLSPFEAYHKGSKLESVFN